MSATPILDLEQPLPKPAAQWQTQAFAVAVAVCTVVIIFLADDGRLPAWHWPAFNGLLLVPALYVVIAGHELGHLVAAKLNGIQSGGFSVGGFMILKSEGKWVFRFNRRRWLSGFFKPHAGEAGTSVAQCAWMVAGGPLASFALAIMCRFVWARLGNGKWEWMGTLYWSALGTAILSLIPTSGASMKSDAARLWQSARRPREAAAWIALMAVQTENSNGVRPRHWNAARVSELLQMEPGTNDYLYSRLLLYYRCLDENSPGALAHLENALAASAMTVRLFRHAVFLEACAASAILRNNAAQAREWLERACAIQKPKSTYVTDAAIAMCEHRYAEAAEYWRQAIFEVDKQALKSGLVRFALERRELFEADCRIAAFTSRRL